MMSQASDSESNIKKIKIEGFKSIRSVELELKPLNILVGANGAGKSNFIGVFKFLHELSNQNLQHYVRRSGGADRILHFGSKRTQRIVLDLDFGINPYHVELGVLPEYDTLLEKPVPKHVSKLLISKLLKSYKIYHFHDTSAEAPMKKTSSQDDNLSLQSDARNIGAYLYRLKESPVSHYQHSYRKIVKAIQLVAPFFQDFILEPDEIGNILPRWKHRDSEQTWSFQDLSDGTLRFICLATLLGQPIENIPSTLIIDEPELGLHPFAINLLAEMLKSVAAAGKQVIVASQSVTLLNHFSVEDLLVADQVNNETVIRRLSPEDVQEWIQDYSLGAIWEHHIIGGVPDDY